MQSSRSIKVFIYSAVTVAAVLFLLWFLLKGRKGSSADEGTESPIESPSRVLAENGVTSIKVTESDLRKTGIITAPLQEASGYNQLKGYGTVASVQELSDIIQSYANAKAQSERARATAVASLKDYDRIKILFDKGMESEKSLQYAEAVWRSDQAAADAAQATLSPLENSIRQRWGKELAEWIFTDAVQLHRLLRQEDLLIQVTFSPDVPLPAKIPPTALVQPSSGIAPFIKARFVSFARLSDPRFQGVTLFYIVPSSQTTLVAGMNVVTYLPTTGKVRGVVIPSSAIVLWQGKSWVYTEHNSATFARVEIPTDNPLEQGFFVTTNPLKPGARIVTRGAQALLSEESRSQIKILEENE